MQVYISSYMGRILDDSGCLCPLYACWTCLLYSYSCVYKQYTVQVEHNMFQYMIMWYMIYRYIYVMYMVYMHVLHVIYTIHFACCLPGKFMLDTILFMVFTGHISISYMLCTWYISLVYSIHADVQYMLYACYMLHACSISHVRN